MNGDRITEKERARLHEALDLAIGLKNALTDASGKRRSEVSLALVDLVLGEITAPLAKDALAERFEAEFRVGSTGAPIKQREPTDPAKAASAAGLDFRNLNVSFERTGVQQGLRRASAFMLRATRPLFPAGVAEQISGAIVAEYHGDEGWIRSPGGETGGGKTGQRTTDFSRSVFYMALVQMVAYWQGMHPGLSEEKALVDVLDWLGIDDMSLRTFQRAKKRAAGFAPGCFDIAHSAGRAEMEGAPLNERQRGFLEDLHTWRPEIFVSNWIYLKPRPAKAKSRSKDRPATK